MKESFTSLKSLVSYLYLVFTISFSYWCHCIFSSVVTELWQARLCEWFHKVNQRVSVGLTQAHKPEVSGSIPLPATKTFSSSIKQTCQFCRFKPKVEHIITIINLFVTLVWQIFSIWSGKGEIILGDYTITLRDFCVKIFAYQTN